MQTLFSHSDKSPKQTKTETSQQGSHRQKSPWPEVITLLKMGSSYVTLSVETTPPT